MKLPSRGVVRFQRDGSGLQAFLSSRHRISSLRPIDELSFAISSTTEGGESSHYRIQYGVFPGRPLNSFPESSHDETDLYHAGDLIFMGNRGKKLELISTVEGLVQLERSSDGWWAAALNPSGSFLIRLSREGAKRELTLDLDHLKDAELFPYLASPVAQIQKETIFEILRRKRSLRKEIQAMLQDRQSPSFVAALALLSQMGGPDSFELLADAGRLSHHPAAFRLLADRPEAENHPVFREITEATNPEVTTEILAAIARSGSRITGLASLVLGFAGVDDEELAAAARAWLIHEQASDVCFDAIDQDSSEATRSAALAVLSRIHKPTVAEGLVLRLEQTDDTRFRHEALAALCDLYYANGEGWKSTPLIDAFLRASLTDRRVKTAWLLDQILIHSIPVGDAEEVVGLAKTEISLQAVSVELLSGKEAVSEGDLVLLKQISENESHDLSLRAKALALSLAGHSFPDAFRRVSKALSWNVLAEAETLLWERWHERSDFAEQSGFLKSKLKSSSDSEAMLASRSLSLVDPEPAKNEESVSEYEEGYALFEEMHCGRCHNIHGEGPAVGPDLVSYLGEHTDQEFVSSVVNPGHDLAGGYESALLELKTGVQLRGIIQIESGDRLQLVDRAANIIDLPKDEIRWRWIEEKSLMPSNYEERVSKNDLGKLIAFLRGISSIPASE